VAAIAILGFVAYYVRNRKFRVDGLFIITLATLTMLISLFTLPVMHERYGYLPEVIAVSYAVTNYKRLVALVMMQFVSIVTYSKFLFGTTVEDMWLMSLMNLVIIILVGYDLYKQMKTREVADA
jgi:glucose uptake protein GlcU